MRIKKDGGLGVGTLKAQNVALLTKWWWRLKNETGSISTNVINSIHNLNNKPACYLVKKNITGVWSNIVKAIRSLKLHNIDPHDLFSLVPGENVKILFWKDTWWGDVPLEEKFPSLYNLEMVKRCTLLDILCSSGPGNGTT